MAITSPPASIFKAYDIRGLYGEEMDAETAHLIGRAFARVLGEPARQGDLRAAGRPRPRHAPDRARDGRGRSATGWSTRASRVLDAGQIATEMIYFLVGSRELDGGAMVTASHNPKPYTGVKLMREGALALSGDAGIQDVRAEIEAGLPDPPGGGSVEEVGRLSRLPPAHARHRRAGCDRPAADPRRRRQRHGGPMVGPLLEQLNLEVTTTYWEPDGNFPDREPNPLLEENRRLIVEQVKEQGVDLAIAWDGDADRCFFIDGEGSFCDGDFVCALLARAALGEGARRDRSSTTRARAAPCPTPSPPRGAAPT